MLEGLEAYGPAGFLRASLYFYPLLSAAHILAIGLLVSAALFMDARVLGLGRGLDQHRVIGALRPVAIGALAAAVVSGALLFSVQPVDYFANPAFRIKMVLLVLAVANAALFTSFRWTDGRTSVPMRLLAVVSIGLWIGVLVSGRFIGFLA